MANAKTLFLDESKLTKLTDIKLADVFKSEQGVLETQLLQIMTQSLGPPVMAIAARVMTLLLQLGRNDRLFNIINSINDLIKMRDDIGSKLAAFAYLNEIYRVLGKKAGPLSGDTIVLLTKIIKNNSEDALLRGDAIELCTSIVLGCNESAISMHKDMFKLARPMLTDKLSSNRTSAAKCLAAMVQVANTLPLEVEGTFHMALKGLDCDDSQARDQLGRLMGMLLCILPLKQNLQPDDILLPLGLAFVRASSKEVRLGVVCAYKHAFVSLGGSWMDRNIPVFIVHALNLLSATRLPHLYSDTLCARKCVHSLLSYVFSNALDETSMIKTVKELCKALSKCGKLTEPSSAQHAMVVALQLIGELLVRLKSLSKPLYEVVKNHVMVTLTYPMLPVRLAAAWCLRCLISAIPRRQASCILECIDKLYSKKTVPDALHGYSMALAALAAIIPASSLGVPRGLSVSMLTMAEELMHNPAKGALALVQEEVAWACVAALTAQGATFFSDHLDKAFSLFRDTFTRTAREEELERSQQTGSEEYISILFSRCHAMGALYFFVHSCHHLLDDCMEKKVLGYLQITTQMAGVSNSNVTVLPDLVRLLKMRVYKTYALLKPTSYPSHLSTLLRLIMSDLVHVVGDVSTTLLPSLCGPDNAIIGGYQEDVDGDLKAQLQGNGLVGALEFDPMLVVQPIKNMEEYSGKVPEPLPSHVVVVDAAVTLFGIVFPYCSTKHKRQLLDHLANCIINSKRSNTSSLHINSLAGLLAALKALEDRGTVELDKGIIEEGVNVLAMGALNSENPLIRVAAAEAVGCAVKCVGGSYVDDVVNATVETLKSDREAISRTGHCLMLGAVMRHAGKVITRRHVQRAMGILNALVKDPAPIVQLWACQALWITSESSAFMNFITHAVDQLWSFFFSFNHRDLKVIQCLGHLLNTLMTAQGPELQANPVVRQACIGLSHYLTSIDNPGVSLVAVQCIQTLVVFAANHHNVTPLLPYMRTCLLSPLPSLRLAACNCLYQMIQRDAVSVAEHGLEHLMLQALNREDVEANAAVLKKCILELIRYLAVQDPGRWLLFCNHAMSVTLEEEDVERKGERDDDLQSKKDDEDEETEKGLVDTGLKKHHSKGDVPRSPLKEFSMACIRELMHDCASCPEHRLHLDLKYMRQNCRGNRERYLVNRLSALVGCAFNAATSDSDSLRLAGFRTLLDIIRYFGQAPDPDFEDISLLEQYQAQIGAALRPAFGEDVDPSLSALAGRVCGAWVSSGVTKDQGELRRIQQLIVGPITDSEDTKYAMYNEATGMTVRVALLHAWAEIQLACNGPSQRTYLAVVIDPFLPRLAKLWLDVLRDYAILQLPPRYAVHLGSGEPLVNQWTRDAVKEHYDSSWTTVMAATALLMPTEYGDVFLKETDDKSRPLPSDSLYLMFSLCIQALSTSPNPEATATSLYTLANLFSTRIDWSEAAVRLDFPNGEVESEGRPKDLIVELITVLKSIILSHEDATRLLVIGLLRRILGLPSMLRDDSSVLPSESRVYAVVDLCVCALSTYDSSLVDRPSVPLVKMEEDANKKALPDSRVAIAALASLTSLPSLCCLEATIQVLPTILLLVLRCVCGKDTSLVASGLKQLHTVAHTTPPTSQDQRDKWDSTFIASLSSCLTALQPLIANPDTLTTQSETIRNIILAIAILYAAVPKAAASLTTQSIDVLLVPLKSGQLQLQLTALQAIRSLLQVVDASIIAHFIHGLLPEVVMLLHKVAEFPLKETNKEEVAVYDEAMHIIVLLVELADTDKVVSILCLLVPTFVSLLETDDSSDSQPLHPLALNHLLKVAATHP
eukprot:Ihof_evm3s99 gene=Ihof_evmTU3s99